MSLNCIPNDLTGDRSALEAVAWCPQTKSHYLNKYWSRSVWPHGITMTSYGRNSVSNHQPHHCLLNRLFRPRSKKTSKLRVTGLSAGNSPGIGEFPAQMASNAENVSIWWRHHGVTKPQYAKLLWAEAYSMRKDVRYIRNVLFRDDFPQCISAKTETRTLGPLEYSKRRLIGKYRLVIWIIVSRSNLSGTYTVIAQFLTQISRLWDFVKYYDKSEYATLKMRQQPILPHDVSSMCCDSRGILILSSIYMVCQSHSIE